MDHTFFLSCVQFVHLRYKLTPSCSAPPLYTLKDCWGGGGGKIKKNHTSGRRQCNSQNCKLTRCRIKQVCERQRGIIKYLFRAGKSLRLQEEIGERHEDEEAQVGEQRDEVPQTCRETNTARVKSIQLDIRFTPPIGNAPERRLADVLMLTPEVLCTIGSNRRLNLRLIFFHKRNLINEI